MYGYFDPRVKGAVRSELLLHIQGLRYISLVGDPGILKFVTDLMLHFLYGQLEVFLGGFRGSNLID